MSKKSNEIQYTYIGEDVNGKPFSITYHTGDLKANGSPFTDEEIIFLRDADHRMDLGDRYYEESKSSLFEFQKRHFNADNSDDYLEPMDELPNRTDNNPLSVFLEKYESEGHNPTAKKLMELVDALPPDEYELFQALYLIGMCLREYGRSIETNESTLRYRHRKLLKKLKNLL